METWVIVILSVLILLFLVSTTFTTVMYKRQWECRYNFSPLCYDDWQCCDGDIARTAITQVNQCTLGPNRECPCPWHDWYHPPEDVKANTCTVPT